VECSGGPRGGFYRTGEGRQRGGRSNDDDEWLLRPLRLGLKGIQGGVMGGGVVMARRHPRRGAGGAGSGSAVETRPGSAGAVEKMKTTSGAHVSAGG
jgi:hypothetical protein